jgi:hypothetical protein
MRGSTATRAALSTADRLVVFVCAASAGIHAGLVPEHLREEPRMGVAFVISVAVLLAVGAAVVLRPTDRGVTRAAALVLGGLVVAYAASRTTGIPLLAPDSEAVDGVGLAAVSIELAGLVLALRPGQPAGARSEPSIPKEVA